MFYLKEMIKKEVGKRASRYQEKTLHPGKGDLQSEVNKVEKDEF